MEVKYLIAMFVTLTFASEGYGVRIGAFNIQVFGSSKMDKEKVVDTLIEIVNRYDVLLIQEIRDKSGQAIQELLEKVNTRFPDNKFNMTLSPRLGRTTSKEQYAYLYREKSGITVAQEFVFDDGDEALNTDTVTVDTFEREPYVVLFHSSLTTVDKFALVGIHVAPSEAVKELQALETVFEFTKTKLGTDNIMVLGDLNADCSYVPQKDWVNIPLKTDPDYTWWIDDTVDTTVGNTNCAYDRFISTGDQLKFAVVNGSVDVFKYDEAYQLDQTMALDVSDHYPIEMTLKTKEGSSGSTSYMRGFGHVWLTILAILFACEKYFICL